MLVISLIDQNTVEGIAVDKLQKVHEITVESRIVRSEQLGRAAEYT